MFTTRDKKLIETTQVEHEYAVEDLLLDKANLELEIAALTSRLDRINSLLMECEVLELTTVSGVRHV